MNRAFVQMSDDAAFTQSDLGCRIVIRQHGDQHFPVARFGKIGRLARTELGERAAFSRSAIEDTDIVSGFDEVGCHRASHVTKTNESDFHRVFRVSCHYARCKGAMNSGPTGSVIAVFTMRSISARSAALSDQPATSTAGSS